MCKEQGMFQKGQLSKLAGMDVPHMQALTEVRVPLLYRQAPSDITGLQDIIRGNSFCSFCPFFPATTLLPPPAGIRVVISLQLGNHAMAESVVRGFSLEETPVSHNSPPAPRPCTEGIITSCLLLVGTIQITLDEWSPIYKRSLCCGRVCFSNSPSVRLCPEHWWLLYVVPEITAEKSQCDLILKRMTCMAM